eukprot:s702_g19.t1
MVMRPLCAWFLLLLPPRTNRIAASVLSSSQLEACVNDGSEQMECELKMVLTVTLEHGQQSTESAQFFIREVTDAEDETRKLKKPWKALFSLARVPSPVQPDVDSGGVVDDDDDGGDVIILTAMMLVLVPMLLLLLKRRRRRTSTFRFMFVVGTGGELGEEPSLLALPDTADWQKFAQRVD